MVAFARRKVGSPTLCGAEPETSCSRRAPNGLCTIGAAYGVTATHLIRSLDIIILGSLRQWHRKRLSCRPRGRTVREIPWSTILPFAGGTGRMTGIAAIIRDATARFEGTRRCLAETRLRQVRVQ